MNEQSEKKQAAPYIPFLTFISALDNVAANSVPNFIDRHSFPSFSGAAVAGTLSAFRFFGLIDANGKPEEALHSLAMNKDARKQNIKALLERHYSELIALDLSRTTPSEFDREFSSEKYSVSGDTRVKAKTFFIKAAQYAEIPISKLLLKKSRSSGPRKPRKPKGDVGNGAAGNTGTIRESTTPPSDSPAGEATKIVELRGGGMLTLIASVNILTLKGSDRDFVFEIIDSMDKYESGAALDAPQKVLPIKQKPDADTSGES